MTNYYVSSSGNNGNPGTEGSPWLTLAYALAAITAGDTLYIRGGASAGARVTWSERIDIAGGTFDSGTSGSPITVTNYPGEFIKFLGGAAGSVDMFRVEKNFWKFSFQAALAGVYYAVADMNDTGSQGRAWQFLAATDCVLENIEIYNGGYDMLIDIRRSSRITIQDCLIHDNNHGAHADAHGIQVTPVGGDCDDVVIQRCTIYDCMGDCIQSIVRDTASYWVNRLIVQDCHLYTTLSGSSENGFDHKNGQSTIFRRNALHGFRYCDGSTGGTGGGSNGGNAIVIHQNGGSISLYDNVIYDVSGPAVFINASVTVHFYRNVAYDPAAVDSPQPPAWVYVNNGTVYVNKNTFYGKHASTGQLLFTGAYANVTLQNNIFHSTGTITEDPGYVRSLSYNCWYNAAETISGAGDLTSDPLLVDVSADDYRIGPASPCIDVGVVVSPYTDGYHGSGPDLGYYERVPASAGPPSFVHLPSMASEYRLVIRSAAGVKQADVSDFLALTYSKRLNEPGLAVFSLPDNHQALTYLDWRAQVEVWRRNAGVGLGWYCDFYGLVADYEWRDGPPGVVTIYAPGQMTMLGWRCVLYAAGVANRSAFTSAAPETIAKALVTYNATASGSTGDGRKRLATIDSATITIQTDSAAGTAIDFNCAWDNLLQSLQKIAAISQMDFDLIKTAAATWEFRWYAAQRGVDRSATLLFTPNRDNLAKASYAVYKRESKTTAIVGGRGTGADRDVVVRTGADYAANYDIETFVNSSGQDSTTAAYQAAGDRALDTLRARPRIRFEVRQTQACYYGLHYCVAGDLGDKIRWAMWTKSGTAKIHGVNVNVKGAADNITVETADV